ncbi:MAG: hypothetical protein GMKNLPBB_01874 [Myxococcota bacterium]|nr:hypothetical protein [Myxococcota bacterium]
MTGRISRAPARLAGFLLTGALLAAGAARASDFIDTRVSFSFVDENVLVKPGETNPSNPGARIGGGDRNTLFFDNYNTRFSGFETLSHLVMYKRMPAYFEGLETEASLVLRFFLVSDRNTVIQDSGSYIRLIWSPEKEKDERNRSNISFTGFPLSGDRFRLGYSYRISWGGSPIFFKPASDLFRGGIPFVNNPNATPAFKFEIKQPCWYSFIGLKTTQLLNQEIQEEQTNYGLLAGWGIDFTRFFRWEVNGGWFERGVNPNRNVLGKPVHAFGGSTQIAFFEGIEPETSIDFRLYRNGPEDEMNFFAPTSYRPGFSWKAASELTLLGQTLEDPGAAGGTVVQKAMAGDVNLEFRWNRFRLFGDAAFQSLSFVLHNVPGFVPFQDFSKNSEQGPEFFAAVGLDYYFENLHLTPGLQAGLQVPAWFKGKLDAGNNPGTDMAGERKVVVRREGDFSILPPGENATPIIAFKAPVRWQISDFMALLTEVYFQIDNNETRLTDNAQGIAIREFQNPYRFGYNLIVQARF